MVIRRDIAMYSPFGCGLCGRDDGRRGRGEPEPEPEPEPEVAALQLVREVRTGPQQRLCSVLSAQSKGKAKKYTRTLPRTATGFGEPTIGEGCGPWELGATLQIDWHGTMISPRSPYLRHLARFSESCSE
jgi:hypothetical protein